VDFARIIEFTGNHLYLVLAFAGTLAALLFSEIRRHFSGMQSVGPMEATQLSNHENAVFLDIREDGEYKGGHIPDCIHIPFKQLSERVNELNRFRNSPVIAYCRSGARSGSAGTVLKKHGFENVYNLEGGITAWQKASLPVTTK
jgi:rhodanese-related sulfurtransferase